MTTKTKTMMRHVFALATAFAVAPSLAAAQSADPPASQPAAAEVPPTTQGPAPEEKRKLRTATEQEEEETAPPPEDEVQWGVGAYSRFITLPSFVFDLFVDHSTSMNSFAVAGSVVRRKGNFDIVFTLEYASTSPKDGLWQEKGEEPGMPSMNPDYVDFQSLAFLSGDVSFIWHAPLTDFMAFRYGVGIGIGVPLNGYEHADTECPPGTRLEDLDNPSRCPVTGVNEEDDLPPVLPVVNLLAGLRFKIVDQLSLQVEVGWRFPAFFAGAGLGYFF